MGIQIDREHFDEADYQRFEQRLERCLAALGQLLGRPGFGVGPATMGAELELFLVDRASRPLALNEAIRRSTLDSRVTLEVDRFNLELNLTPTPLAGRPFAAFGAELREAIGVVRRAADAHGGRVAVIGILPTLRRQDLTRRAITDAPRYRALNNGLRRLRHEPFRVRIAGEGEEVLEVDCDDVSLEGANTSFQVHLRVDPACFARTYNAVQLATVPVLAAAGNSPAFLGRLLWEETRIALFKQAVDDRDQALRARRVSRVAFGIGWVRAGAQELFAESVRLHEPLLAALDDEDPLDALRGERLPALAELRLHQGTVWRWNRAVYDPAAGGHLRIEMRALPAGPTVVDMLANAAFLVGLSLALAPRADELVAAFPFERAHHSFYRAAQYGLDAELAWPAGPGRLQAVPAAELALQLLPLARQGLEQAGVAADEADHLLGVVEARVASRRTGAAWQRGALATLADRLGHEQALAAMLERYLANAATEQPVHAWPAE